MSSLSLSCKPQLSSRNRGLTDGFHQLQMTHVLLLNTVHACSMPGGGPLATCTLPVGDVYLLTYLQCQSLNVELNTLSPTEKVRPTDEDARAASSATENFEYERVRGSG
jgi:hypothetical protein